MSEQDVNNLAGQQAGQPETMLAAQLAILAELRVQTGLLAAMNERGARKEAAAKDAAACLETERQVDALYSLCGGPN